MLNRLASKARGLIAGRKPAQVSTPAWGVPNPRESDIYLVSYPKSGNTWMRYLLTYSIWPESAEMDLVEMASYIPSYRLPIDMEAMLAPGSPCNHLPHRIIKEHTRYDERSRQHIKRAIYIARDGRDAIVSYWHFCNQRDNSSIPFSEFIEISARPGHSYGPWSEHVRGWLNAPLEAKLILRYEDMLTDTFSCLKRALEFAEIDVADSAISKAIDRASFNSMRKLEKTKGFNLDQLKNVEFVRQGKSDAWRDTFAPGDIERFNKFHGGCVHELGYSW
jgi:hypothetical protein